MDRVAGKLNPHEPYSSRNRHITRNITYGGFHDNALIDRGDNLITWSKACPVLLNKMDISPVTGHDKPWCIAPALKGRIHEPQHQAFGPTVHKQGACGGRRNGQAYR
jgi:hypothetical protein